MLDWIVDLRADLSAVGDQGMRLTCLAWALSTAHHHIATLEEFPSVEYLHWASGIHPSGRGRIPAAVEAVSVYGQPADSQWPYRQDLDESDPAYSPPPEASGPFARASVRRCSTRIDQLEHELLDGSCPVVGLRVTDKFLRASGGLITVDGPGTDGHAVVITGLADYVGPDDLPGVAIGSRLVCVRNSWGPTWGVGGDALMTQAAVDLTAIAALVLEPLPQA